jgi:hypothetical protein
LNYDLKVYLEEPAFQPFLNSSVERINHGADENEEIDKAIKHMARQYLAVIKEAMEEEDGNSSSSSGSSSSSSSSSRWRLGAFSYPKLHKRAGHTCGVLSFAVPGFMQGAYIFCLFGISNLT